MEIITSFHRIEFGAWQFAKEASQLRQGTSNLSSRRFRMLTAIRLLILMHICTRRLRQKTLFLDCMNQRKFWSVWMHGTAKSESNFCGRSKTCVPV